MKQVTNEAIVSALLTHRGIKNAAAVLQVSENTIRKRMHEKEFAELYASAQTALLQAVVIQCQSLMTAALDECAGIMCDKEVNAQTRLLAAQTILKNGIALYGDTIRINAARDEQNRDNKFRDMIGFDLF